MPIYIDNPCDYCIYRHKELLNGWIPTCDAFSKGNPINFIPDRTGKAACNNGIGYEQVESEGPDWWKKKKKNFY